jgi:hypothetical protein
VAITPQAIGQYLSRRVEDILTAPALVTLGGKVNLSAIPEMHQEYLHKSTRAA